MVGVTVGYKVRILRSSGIVKISPKRIRVVGVVGTPRLVRGLVLFWIVSILLGVAAGGIPSDHYWAETGSLCHPSIAQSTHISMLMIGDMRLPHMVAGMITT